RGKIDPKLYQDLKISLRLSQTFDRKDQEDILLAKLLQQSGIVDSIHLEEAFLKLEKSRQKGEKVSLSSVLKDMGILSEEEWKNASSLLDKIEVRCEKCGKKFALQALDKDAPLQCPDCSLVLLPETYDEAAFDMMQTMASISSAGLERETEEGKQVTESSFDEMATMLSIEGEGGDTATTDPLVGKRLGECRILKKLGQGGMGAVYLGENLKLGRKEAIKVLSGEGAANAEQLMRFQREARAAGTLDSPHIVRVYNIGEDQGIPYISMEFVEGESIQDKINRDKKIEIKEAIDYIRQAAKGLLMAHEKGIIHRDIKPDNLLVTKDGTVKVADFGLARKIEDTMGITQTGAIMGTPYFMSPEQCSGNPTDERSDIYSLGATFYYMLTGKHPFTGESPMAILLKHINEEVIPPSQIDPSIPISLSNVVEKMMEKSADFRYPSLSDFLEDLKKVEEGEEIGISEGKKKRIFRRRLRRIATLILLVLLATLFYFALINRGEDRDAIQNDYNHSLQKVKTAFLLAKKQKKLAKLKKEYDNLLKLLEKTKKYKFLSSLEVKKLLFDYYMFLGDLEYKKALQKSASGDKEGFFKAVLHSKEQYLEGVKILGKTPEVIKALEQLAQLELDQAWSYLKQKQLDVVDQILKEAPQISPSVETTKGYQLLKNKAEALKLEMRILSLVKLFLRKIGASKDEEVPKSLRRVNSEALKDGQKILKQAFALNGPSKLQQRIKKLEEMVNQEETFRQRELENINERKAELARLQQEGEKIIQDFQELFKQKGEEISLEVLEGLVEQIRSYSQKLPSHLFTKKIQQFAFELQNKAKELESQYSKYLQTWQKEAQKWLEKSFFIQKYQAFLAKYGKKKIVFHPKILQNLDKEESKLISLGKKAFGEANVYKQKIQNLANQVKKEVALQLFTKTKNLALEAEHLGTEKGKEKRQKRNKALQLLRLAQRYYKNPQAAQLLVRLRAPAEYIETIGGEKRVLLRECAYIPGGKYRIGAGDISFMKNPINIVNLKSFYLSKYEITNEEYLNFYLDGGYKKPEFWGGAESKGWKLFHGSKKAFPPYPMNWENLRKKDGTLSFQGVDQIWKRKPVGGINFYEAMAYCRWISQKLSVKYSKEWKRKVKILARLPSHAEWEVAASYGPDLTTPHIYPWGNKFQQKDFVFLQGSKVREIGSWEKDRSGFGIFDMAGNVSEWVIQAPGILKCGGLRGASYDSTNPKIQSKCSYAGFRPKPHFRFEDVGFRILIETKEFEKP
ncbi:MAG: hypothetical protein D6785_01755, partial [Planctomycetota bacterium]